MPERSRNHKRKERKEVMLGSRTERWEGEGGHRTRTSGSSNSCQDYLAQLGFMLSKKAVGKVGGGANSGQKRGLPGTGKESPQLPIEAFLYLSYRCWQRCVLGTWRGMQRQDRWDSWSTQVAITQSGWGKRKLRVAKKELVH